MRILFNLVSILIIVSVLFLASINTQTTIQFMLWLPGKHGSLAAHINLVNLIFFILIAGIISGALWAASFYLSAKDKLKEYQKKLEKSSIQTSEDSSKVAVLESKIEVLEKALQAALEKNNEE